MIASSCGETCVATRIATSPPTCRVFSVEHGPEVKCIRDPDLHFQNGLASVSGDETSHERQLLGRYALYELLCILRTRARDFAGRHVH